MADDWLTDLLITLRIIDVKEEAGASMYKGTLIYAKPFLAWRYSNLVYGYNSSI